VSASERRAAGDGEGKASPDNPGDGCGLNGCCNGDTALTMQDRDMITDHLANASDIGHGPADRMWRALRVSETAHEQDRAAVRALVDALPRCWACSAVAFSQGLRGGLRYCEEHEAANAAQPNPARAPQPLPYADPLRVLLTRIAEWPSVGAPAPLTPAQARADADRLRAIADDARASYIRAECHALELEGRES
jgi:hypothetical protein